MNYRLFEPDDFDELYAIEEMCFQPPLRFSRAIHATAHCASRRDHMDR